MMIVERQTKQCWWVLLVMSCLNEVCFQFKIQLNSSYFGQRSSVQIMHTKKTTNYFNFIVTDKMFHSKWFFLWWIHEVNASVFSKLLFDMRQVGKRHIGSGNLFLICHFITKCTYKYTTLPEEDHLQLKWFQFSQTHQIKELAGHLVTQVFVLLAKLSWTSWTTYVVVEGLQDKKENTISTSTNLTPSWSQELAVLILVTRHLDVISKTS